MKLSEEIAEVLSRMTFSPNPNNWGPLQKKALEWGRKAQQLEADLKKWRNWMPDDEDLKEMKLSAIKPGTSYHDSKTAGFVYTSALEARLRQTQAELETYRKNRTSILVKYLKEQLQQAQEEMDELIKKAIHNTTILMDVAYEDYCEHAVAIEDLATRKEIEGAT